MYTLYWCPRTASLAPELLLALAGLPYEKRLIDVKTGQNREPAYLAINPTGFVPALALPEGGTLAETAAIMLYLCDRHGLDLAPAPTAPERAAFLQDMQFLSSVIQATYKRVYFPQRFAAPNPGDPGDPADSAVAEGIKARALEMQEEHWALMARRLEESGGPFLAGARCTAADLYLAMLASWHPAEVGLVERTPALARCVGAVMALPAVRPVALENGYRLAEV